MIRDREALAALDPFEDTMLLTTLHWPDEIRSTKELDLPAEEFEFKPAELRMAEQLVEAMTEEFDPAKYRDEYREALLSVIQAKVDGVEVAEPEPVAESANLVDLMKLLQASVKAATDERARETPEPVSVAQAKTGPGDGGCRCRQGRRRRQEARRGTRAMRRPRPARRAAARPPDRDPRQPGVTGAASGCWTPAGRLWRVVQAAGEVSRGAAARLSRSRSWAAGSSPASAGRRRQA